MEVVVRIKPQDYTRLHKKMMMGYRMQDASLGLRRTVAEIEKGGRGKGRRGG